MTISWRTHLPIRFLTGLGAALIVPWIASVQGDDRPRTLGEISQETRIVSSAQMAGNRNGITDGSASIQAASTVTLADCVQMAMDRQPALAARRASLAAAQENRKGLDNLKLASILVRELPIRRKQACLGVIVASAGVDQAERETIYAVTRTFYSVLYAREQKKVAESVVDHLKATLETARRLVEGGSREVTTSSADKITVYLRLAENRLSEASQGSSRATAALKEAIGTGPEYPLEVAEEGLPNPQVAISKEAVINLALSRRGELVQATNVAEVTCLEVDAQGTSFLPSFHTFASVVDLHAQSIPQGISDGEYRPGAIGPEMPTTMAGHRRARVERARAFYNRAGSVVDKTRNLIALEAEDAYLRWEDFARRVPLARAAASMASKLSDDTRKDFGGEQKVKPEDVLTNEVLSATARAGYNEALYQQILALAALERVTGGGFSAGFVSQPAVSTLPSISSETPINNGN